MRVSHLPLRIVFLAVDDEFAGSMQRYVYERYSAQVVGSVISKTAIYKKSAPRAALFVLRRSGPRYLGEMFRMKVLRRLGGSRAGVTPSQLAVQHGVEQFHCRGMAPSFYALLNSEQSVGATLHVVDSGLGRFATTACSEGWFRRNWVSSSTLAGSIRERRTQYPSTPSCARSSMHYPDLRASSSDARDSRV